MNVATESIYNLIPKPAKEEEKKPIYRSKHDPKAPLTGSTFGLHGTVATMGRGVHELKKTCVITSTFGPAVPKKPDPSNFLRRGSRTMVKRKSSNTSSTKFQRPQLEAKPPIPSSNDRPIMGLKTTKNFIVSNATQAIIQEPKKLKDKEESFLEKDTYGKIPSYLHKVKQDIQREKELVEEYVKQQNHDEKVDGGSSSHEGTEYEIMDEDERQNLIRSLKKKWDEVNSRYQKICHRVTIDSLGDIKRKEMQEAELQQLEDDIQRLSRPGPLYILKQQ